MKEESEKKSKKEKKILPKPAGHPISSDVLIKWGKIQEDIMTFMIKI